MANAPSIPSAPKNYYQTVGKGGTLWTSNEGKAPDASWYAQDLAKYAEGKGYASQYDAIDKQYSANSSSAGSSGSNGSSTGNSSGGDWNSSNPNYSYSTGASSFTPQDYYSLAKDLSQQQLNNSITMMGESSKYRMSEANQNTYNTDVLSKHQSIYDQQSYASKTNDDLRKNLSEMNQQTSNTDVLNKHQSIYDQQSYTARTTDDMRRDAQQYGFQEALDNLKYGQESKIQGAQFEQNQTMFNMQDQAAIKQKQGNRAAASNLYNTSGKSPFFGGY